MFSLSHLLINIFIIHIHIMGTTKSKEEIIIANNGSQIETQVYTHNFAIIGIIVFLIMLVCYIVNRRCRYTAKTWLRKQLTNIQPPTIVTVPSLSQQQASNPQQMPNTSNGFV